MNWISKTIILLLFLSSCARVYEFEPALGISEIYIEALLSEANGVRAYVSTTNPPNYEYYNETDYALSMASVIIYDIEGNKVDSLLQDDDGYYYSTQNLYQSQRQYKLEVSHPRYEMATSEYVTIPTGIQKAIIQASLQDSLTAIISLELIDRDSLHGFGYAFSIVPTAENQVVNYIPTANQHQDFCEEIRYRFKGLNENMYESECFIRYGAFNLNRLSLNSSEEEFNYSVTKVGAGGLNYYRSLNNQPSEWDRFFDSPMLLQGNIDGGVGIFYGGVEYIFPIKF